MKRSCSVIEKYDKLNPITAEDKESEEENKDIPTPSQLDLDAWQNTPNDIINNKNVENSREPLLPKTTSRIKRSNRRKRHTKAKKESYGDATWDSCVTCCCKFTGELLWCLIVGMNFHPFWGFINSDYLVLVTLLCGLIFLASH